MFRLVHVLFDLLTLSYLNAALHSEDATESHKLAAALRYRSEPVPKHVTPSSELQASSLDKAVDRKKKKAEDSPEEIDALDPSQQETASKSAEVLREDKAVDEQVDNILERYESDPSLVPLAKKEGGQVLRGTMNFYGIIFAVGMNRGHFKKTLHDNWFVSKKNRSDVTAKRSRKYWTAEGEMYFKLLRYPTQPEDRRTFRERTAKKAKALNQSDTILMDNLQKEGWTGKVKLRGWWNDVLSNFKGKVKKKEVYSCGAGEDVNDLSFLHWAGQPWEDVDIRFDNEGAHCTASFPVETKGFFGRLFGKEKRSYITWRMDALALDPYEVESRVYQGTAALPYWHGGNTFSTRLRLDDCFRGDNKQTETFTCTFDMRPLGLFNLGQSEALNNPAKEEGQMYAVPPKGSLGGPWFTYIGMHGKLEVRFEPDGDGNYQGEAMGSWCGGENPCPFLLRHFQHLKVVMLPDAVMMQPQGEIVDPEHPDQVPDAIYLYPVYDDSFIQTPHLKNYQKLPLDSKSTYPILQDPLWHVVKMREDEYANKRLERKKELMRTSLQEYDEQHKELRLKLSKCRIVNWGREVREGGGGPDLQAKMARFQDDLDSLRKDLLLMAQEEA
jgi:hypothetical protein